MSAFWDGIVNRLRETFAPGVLGAALVDLAGNAIVGILTFLAFYLFWWMLHRGVRHLLRRSKVDATTASFTETAVKYVVLIIGLLQAFKAAGIDTAALLASLGIAGLTIGFAARDSLSNLISGLLIFWDRPFVIGDLVEVGGHYGRVDHITLRSTRVVTVDGRMLAVPNSTIINTTVASYTNFPTLRLDVEVSVGVGENLHRVRTLLLDLVQGAEGFLADPAPRVVVKALNDYNVVVELQAWIQDERDHVAMRFRLRERIFSALRDAKVDMPFETLQLAPVELRPSVTPGGRGN
jgi:small conductance mechanosensitive channel